MGMEEEEEEEEVVGRVREKYRGRLTGKALTSIEMDRD